MLRLRNLSENFIIKIIEKAAGRISQKMLEDFLSAIETEITKHYFTRSSESNLLRIILSQFDFAFFVNECLKYPNHFEILLAISINSNYLTDILVRNPEYFHWIINPSILEYKTDKKYFNQTLDKSLSVYKSFESKVNVIRNFKRKEILRIGCKDIYLKQNISKTTKQLSDLAEVISSELFELCYSEILIKNNLRNVKNRYVIFSLGKLGGNELNYSSDIDLIASYDKNSFISKKINFNKLLTDAIHLFINTAGAITSAGFLYRIDFRLRPDGRNAPLCGSYLDYLKYYEMRGEDWERQMLIKANYLCGSKSLYNNFFNYLSKFIYPVSFNVSPIEQIKKLKLNIERRNKSDANIKLSQGGIRDIEFSVQALQLLNGGKYDTLKNGNTLTAIKLLKEKNILSDNEAETFTESYILYRKVEHYLQLMNDQQTHLIPESGELAERLAYYLGYKNLGDFKRKIQNSKEKVHSIYLSIFEQNVIEELKPDTSVINFFNLKRSEANLEYLRTGKGLFEQKQFDTRTTTSFEKIEPEIIEHLKNSFQPDLALDNFVRIIRSAHFPHLWYDEFSDKKFLNLTFQLCDYSQKAIDIFAEDKPLRDELLSRICLIPLTQIDISTLSLKQFLFRSSVQLTASILTAENFSKLYSNFLTNKISSVINNNCIDKSWKDNFIVLAMGGFGNQQMSFASDIDLIFIVNDINSYPSIQTDFQKLLNMIRDNLKGLDIDCRLRPEGKSSQLVWDVEEYKKYFLSRARIWELQAFIKCRLLYGSKDIYKDFYSAYLDVIKSKNKTLIKSEMAEMRKKLLPVSYNIFDIKKSKGGLYDIDFIFSYLHLTNQMTTLSKSSDDSIQKENMLNELKRNFSFLKLVEIFNQNIFNTKSSKIPIDEIKLKKLSISAGFKTKENFLNKLDEVIHSNKKYFQTIFNK
ncbi:MAG: hypothetical protein B6D44_11875 [Ignavibacteriales bacterium UTCHB2]|jgi:glutamate-ammonia-ligase adenylyltransferase|nr:MAG: Glutamate-ammonia-ligase adenylyltransferase [Ignavibacteria bacterium ADurb.Bin266]OQY71761.1 MAG: hypothetical protein B6D44_11875 [Ignavibacteriales bacterium UTCHB2]HQI41504.1 hypothetical protein [Ignavibacteriaceae bacterium]